MKFKLNGRLLHKSKTVHRDLNPIWDETFVVPIEDPFQIIYIKMFDYDWGLQDDFMGSAKLDLTTLELSRTHEMLVKLEDPSRLQRDLGELRLNVTLWPRTQEDKEQVNGWIIKSMCILYRANSYILRIGNLMISSKSESVLERRILKVMLNGR